MYSQIHYLPPDVECHIVCERTENLDQFGLPNIHCLYEQSRWWYLWDKGLRKLRLRRHLGFYVQQARRHDTQLLHSHFGNIGWADQGAAKRVGIKHVVTFYGRDVNLIPTQDPRWHDRYRELFTSVDLILCEGPFMAQSIAALGCPEEKIAVHHLGVRIDKIAFKPRTWKQGELLRILIASTFREKKGIPYAIEAIGQLQNQPPMEVTIIGDAKNVQEEQREKEAILQAITKYNLERNVRFLGFQSFGVMLEEAYQHHIFISPSVTASDGDTEGGAPISLIEMAATGMPIISTTHCDIPEVVCHGKSGWLAPERDAEAIAKYLRWWIEHPEGWGSMLSAGRHHIMKHFDARAQGEKLAALYYQVTEC
ncbi:glycosyltransferase [Candidatus Neomarinimicrobiota bacterium]